MHARIVRFTDVDPDHLGSRLAEMDAPPVDTAATSVKVFHDPDQRQHPPAEGLDEGLR